MTESGGVSPVRTDSLEVIRSDGGIKNPFAYATFCLATFEYELRSAEVNRLCETFKGVISWSSVIEGETREKLLLNVYHRDRALIREYESELKRLGVHHRKKGFSRDYNCTYRLDNLKLLLRFQDTGSKKKRISIMINGAPILKCVFDALELPTWCLVIGQSASESTRVKMQRAITRDDPKTLLYVKAYFDYYLPKGESAHSHYSLRRALEDANDRLKIFDPATKVWTDGFESIYSGFKKFVQRQTPFLIQLLKD